VSNSDVVRRAFAAVEANDVNTYISLFTDNAFYKAGNFDPVTGPDGIRNFAVPVMEMFEKVTHDVEGMWEDGNTVIAEVLLTYRRRDAKVVTVPCVDVIRLTGGKISALQAYVDLSPVFA
jgi:ketosteroid isomerase-like protein